MHVPDVPYMPLRLDENENDFLNSLEERVEHILIGRKEEERFSVLGYTGGRMGFVACEPYIEEREVDEYVRMDWNKGTGEVVEQREKGVYYYTNTEILGSVCTLGIYGVVRAFSPQQFERERKRDMFYCCAQDYLRKNREELQREVDKIPIYEGPMADVEQRTGKKLEGVTLEGAEQFLRATDTFWLRVAAARVGADMVLQYTPGSAVGTPVRVRKE